MAGPKEHPDRRTLAMELHARPYGLLKPPVRVSHFVTVSGEDGFAADHAHISELCHIYKVAPPATNANHHTAELGKIRLKWERHTEFCSYSFYNFGAFDHPFKNPVRDHLPADWMNATPGELLSATHVAVEPAGTEDMEVDQFLALFDNNPMTGAMVMGERAAFWTDFHVHADGYTRVLIRDHGLNERQCARLVQRVLEIATYRMTAMLGFPVAKALQPNINDFEKRLSAIIQAFADSGSVETERDLLAGLSKLAAETEALLAANGYRFAATNAYFALVLKRLEELRETRIEGVQPPGEFVGRRLTPAMTTVEAMAKRLEALSHRINHATDLLRTRVDVSLQAQNQDLLKSMDRRAKVQLRLQQTVEGLSVVAISYYMVGLVLYLAKGAKAAGLPVSPDIAAGVSLPIVIWAAWMGVRSLRHALTSKEDQNEEGGKKDGKKGDKKGA